MVSACIKPHLMTPALIELLTGYAGVPPEEQEKHLRDVVSYFFLLGRNVMTDEKQPNQAWGVFPIPASTSSGGSFSVSTHHPHYLALLTRLESDSSA